MAMDSRLLTQTPVASRKASSSIALPHRTLAQHKTRPHAIGTKIHPSSTRTRMKQPDSTVVTIIHAQYGTPETVQQTPLIPLLRWHRVPRREVGEKSLIVLRLGRSAETRMMNVDKTGLVWRHDWELCYVVVLVVSRRVAMGSMGMAGIAMGHLGRRSRLGDLGSEGWG